MAVAVHLGIPLDEYDARIRTFIPDYEEMLTVAASALSTLVTATPHIVDLGTGTGALAAACLRAVPRARLTIVDQDADVLAIARQRLEVHAVEVTTAAGAFEDVALPRCDAIVGSLTFHHIRSVASKQVLYRRFGAGLERGGVFLSIDCCPAAEPRLAHAQHAAWHQHLRISYDDEACRGYFAAWAAGDHYMPLATELQLIEDAGFSPDVLWRRGAFAVILGTRF